jgi:hypothetical protein
MFKENGSRLVLAAFAAGKLRLAGNEFSPKGLREDRFGKFLGALRNGRDPRFNYVGSSRLMKWRKERSLDDYRFIERVSKHVGQPTVICPKCYKFVSPPEQLVEHFTRCSTDRRSSVLKQGPLYR